MTHSQGYYRLLCLMLKMNCYTHGTVGNASNHIYCNPSDASSVPRSWESPASVPGVHSPEGGAGEAGAWKIWEIQPKGGTGERRITRVRMHHWSLGVMGQRGAIQRRRKTRNMEEEEECVGNLRTWIRG